MKFHTMLLYVDDRFPSIDTFKQLIKNGTQIYEKNNNLYIADLELVDEKYFWMYFQYDNQKLYTKKVLDISDSLEKDNPRPKNQIELRHQLFACYDFERNLVYISDYSKKSVVSDYIAYMLQKSVVLKNVLKSVDEFAAVATKLKSVTFTQVSNICTNSENSVMQKTANIFGLDLPERSKIKLDYGHSPIGMVKTALQDWKIKRDIGEFDDVIVVGLDDNGLENTFNFSTMISAVEIDALRDENYRYNPDVVKLLLLSKLGVIHGKKS